MVKTLTNKSVNFITHSISFLFFLCRMWRSHTQQFRRNPKPWISLRNRVFGLHLGYFPWGWKQNCSSHLSTLQSSTFLRLQVCCSLTLACKNVAIVGPTMLRGSLSTNVHLSVSYDCHLRATLYRDRVRLKKCGTRLEKWTPWYFVQR